MEYKFEGVIPASKSLMNRALTCSSYDASLILRGSSSCDDVLMMERAINEIRKIQIKDFNEKVNLTLNCGAAGTALRFLALRVSRIEGRHVLQGTTRLMQRPQGDLLNLIRALGVDCQILNNEMVIESNGWKNLSQPIIAQRGVSSQFASGLILNAWGLDQDLVIKTQGENISEGYLDMTLGVVRNLGMQIEEVKLAEHNEYVIKKHSKIIKSHFQVESDLSSAFAIAAYAGLNGRAIFNDFPTSSCQPDFAFIDFLTRMGMILELKQGQLSVKKSQIKGIEANLKSCPDLFPVLATLCAFASGPSRLYGAPQLVHKESNRIAKISELLKFMNVSHDCKDDGMLINPGPLKLDQIKKFIFDTDHDHRLAFAAALVKSQAVPIQIFHPEVVSKSFPEFWQVIGLELKD